MTPSPIRLLFQCHNRRGLGHLVRGLNIAREVRLLAPSSEILFYAKNRSAETRCGSDFRCFVEPDPHGSPHWPDVARSFSPTVIVYDTVLPESPTEDPLLSTVRYVYVMRKCIEAKQRDIFRHPFLRRVDLILIPHTPSEFGYQVPPFLEQKSVFVGPIVRRPDRNIQGRIRDKYRLAADSFILTSTVGGGGFEDSARALFTIVFDVHRRLHPILPNLRHLVIQGPNFGASLTGLDGMTVVDDEPDMVDLLAVSDLVIAEAGYNTVNEIRLARAPAVFLPGGRTYDDQEERARTLEQKGLALVFTERVPEQVSRRIVEVCLSRSRLREMRRRYESDSMETGNRAAAEKILELASR